MNPMQQASRYKPLTKEHIQESAAYLKVSLEEAKRVLEAEIEETEVWVNELYQVQVRRYEDGMIHLNIRRRDGRPILRDWRHFQQIKNELVGAECEAVELYPAESRKVDESNKYHLFAVADPTYRFPFGFEERKVSDVQSKVPGFRQRRGA